jgi:hypothetical protein
MQPGATRVGPSREPSVRRIAVRFLSGATISMKKMIKAQFFRSLSGHRQKTRDVLIAKRVPTRDAQCRRDETDVKTAGWECNALGGVTS